MADLGNTILLPRLSPTAIASGLADGLFFAAPPFTTRSKTLRDLVLGNDLVHQSTTHTWTADSRIGLGVNTVRSSVQYMRGTVGVTEHINTGAGTIACWVRPTTISPGADGYFFTYRNNTSHFSWNMIMKHSTGLMECFWFRSDGENDSATTTSGMVANTWAFLVSTYVPSTFIKVYFNGALETTNTTSIIANQSSWTDIAINLGSPGASSANGFSGALAHPMCWNRALTDGEIKQLYLDPWVLWRHEMSLGKTPAAPSFNPAWAVNSNYTIQPGFAA